MRFIQGVLITGGSGFLGRYVVRECLRTGFEITVLTRNSSLSLPGETLLGDLAQEPPDLKGRRFETVLHLGGLAHVQSPTHEDKRQFYAVNVEGTRNLLIALDAVQELPKSLVFVSTVAVYGLHHGSAINEDTPRCATDPYGMSKRLAEDLVVEWGLIRGVRVGIVRLPLVVGPCAPGNLGAMISALRRYRYWRIGDGKARRSVILAEDAARGLIAIADQGGVFHLTDGHHPSFRELEDAICRGMQRGPPKALPLALAWVLAVGGDVGKLILGRDMPLTTGRLEKMVYTLTFSDEKARTIMGWHSRRVIDSLPEFVT